MLSVDIVINGSTAHGAVCWPREFPIRFEVPTAQDATDLFAQVQASGGNAPPAYCSTCADRAYSV